MKSLALLVSPRAKSAYFNDYIEVAKAELTWLLASLDAESKEVEHKKIAEMDFLLVTATEEILPQLARLSCVYGIFEQKSGTEGEQLLPLPVATDFELNEVFFFFAKF